MTKKFDTTLVGRKRGYRCFMAYTLNNTQPVVCTLVADQPYFYMKEEALFEEDDPLLGFDDYVEFEKEMADLKRNLEACERLSRCLERSPEDRLETFIAESVGICDPAKSSRSNISIDRITNILGQSRMGTALLDCARVYGVSIAESRQALGAQYDRQGGKILIHPDLAESEQCLLVVRELRRHWQHRNGVLIHPLTFHPDQAILINRAQIADLTIAMIRVGWELQLAGLRDVWTYIENSPMSDLGRTFAREAFVDFRSLANGKASSAVFESWFLSERARYHDKHLIQGMLADHQGYVFTNESVSRTVSVELITALGEQPYGKNYLAPYAQMIIADPVFTEVRDRSNANFLWFIKFERSFRETEQALQSEEGLGADGLSAPLYNRPDFSTEHSSNESDSTIVHLDRNAETARGGRGPLHRAGFEESNGNTNVIHVRFGRVERS